MSSLPLRAVLFRPHLTYTLITLCVVIFLWQQVELDRMIAYGALWPWGDHFAPWQLLTYSFLHGNTTHLLFNMLGLHIFGSDLERRFGTQRFAVLYFASVLTAAFAQLLVGALTLSSQPTIGASGGLFGLLFVFAAVFPKRKIVPLIPPIPMPAWLFVTLYAGLELYLGVTGSVEGIAHFAHLGGLIGGFIVYFLWRSSMPQRLYLP